MGLDLISVIFPHQGYNNGVDCVDTGNERFFARNVKTHIAIDEISFIAFI